MEKKNKNTAVFIITYVLCQLAIILAIPSVPWWGLVLIFIAVFIALAKSAEYFFKNEDK